MSAHDWDAAYSGDVAPTPVDERLQQVAGGLAVGTALDLGCGLGQNSLWLAARGWTVTGLDISPRAITAARAAAVEGGLEVSFVVADLTEWVPGEIYDLVVSTYGLPPAGPGRSHALATAGRAVAPGGTLLIAEFDQSLAQKGWMPESDLVSMEEIVGHLEGFTIVTSGVADTAHSHGDHTEIRPVVAVVATRELGPG